MGLVIQTQDTVLVPVAALADSVRAVLDSLSVRLAEPVQVVAPADGWFAPANMISAVAALATIAISIIVVRLEIRQNAIEARLRDQQTEATDKRIGVLAYMLARQLKSWIEEPVGGLGDGLPGHVIRGLRASGDLGMSGGEDDAVIMALANWVRIRCAERSLAPAARIAESMAEAALTASPVISGNAVLAFKSFHQAADSLNRGLARYESGDLDQARWLFIKGYDVLEAAASVLGELIPAHLRGDLFVKDGRLYDVTQIP